MRPELNGSEGRKRHYVVGAFGLQCGKESISLTTCSMDSIWFELKDKKRS